MNYFEPSVARARECRKAMDESLWASVLDLLEELTGGPAVPGAKAATDAARPTNLLDYAAYFDLELTPSADETIPDAAKGEATSYLLRRLSVAENLDPEAASPRITNFSRETYSTDQIERMRRWWDIEPANRMSMIPARDDEFARSCREINIALDYLRDASPELHGEVETIIRDIVMTRPDGTNLINYSGASSFALWGGLTINAETQCEWSQFYRQIVHETAHNLLFAIARDQPLVTNDPADRSRSPIRADPRPVDGVFHAAFVSAREALAFDALLCRHEETRCLPDDDPQVIEDLLEISVFAFRDCIQTLRGGEAQLTQLGDAVLADCEKYMAANFSVVPC